MSQRCATVPYLRLIGFDRKWRGVSPSSAGTGPRLLYLKATTDYTIAPDSRAWAAFGTSTHEKVGMHRYSHNVFSEEPLSDEETRGITDVLEKDEFAPGYILTDYKTFGSYKVGKCLGMVSTDKPVLDEKGNKVLLKSGKNKGNPKTIKAYTIDPTKADLKNETLQLNRYRILFAWYGFQVSRMQLQVLCRDGGTYIAKSRGIDRNLYIIPVPFMPDVDVLNYYKELKLEVQQAFDTGYIRKCNKEESWEGRRCTGYCEVAEACTKMENQTKKGE